MNSVTGSGLVAKCLNMKVDLSFMNSVTGSGLVAKCSNILQDSTVVEHPTDNPKIKGSNLVTRTGRENRANFFFQNFPVIAYFSA